MKNLLYFMIVILVFSCAPKKIIMATKTETITTVQNDIKDVITDDLSTKKTVIDQSNTDTETVTETTTYDSEKPNVPGTDRPPIKEVKKTTEKKVNKGDIKINSEISKKTEAKHEDKSKTDNQVKSEIKVKEIPKAPAVKYWLMLFGFIAVTISILRYWTVIKTFLKL